MLPISPANVTSVYVTTPATAFTEVVPPSVPAEAATVTLAVEEGTVLPKASAIRTTGCVLRRAPATPATGCVVMRICVAVPAVKTTEADSETRGSVALAPRYERTVTVPAVVDVTVALATPDESVVHGPELNVPVPEAIAKKTA